MASIYQLDEFKKFAILKKGIGIESQNLCKQFNDQKTIQTRWDSTVAIEQKVDSKAFTIPILTARLSRWDSTVAIEQKVDSKAFAIPILTARL